MISAVRSSGARCAGRSMYRATPQRFYVSNVHLGDLSSGDFLYHFGLSTHDDLTGLFGDVQYFCMGGSAKRMGIFAQQLASTLDSTDGVASGDVQTFGKTERFSLFKVGPVLISNHGMGMPSMSIMLHEITKMLYYAGTKDVEYIRLGTSGGVGVGPGTVVVSTGALDGLLQPQYSLPILGRVVSRPTDFSSTLAQQIRETAPTAINVVHGLTMATDCFYEGQGRLDGAICDYSEQEKLDFLQLAYDKGVRNIEMEATMFSAFTNHLSIDAADVCVSLLNRLDGDQVSHSPESMAEWDAYPGKVVMSYIKTSLTNGER